MKEESLKVDPFGKSGNIGVFGRMGDVFKTSMALAISQTGVLQSSTILKGDPSIATPVNVVKTGK